MFAQCQMQVHKEIAYFAGTHCSAAAAAAAYQPGCIVLHIQFIDRCFVLDTRAEKIRPYHIRETLFDGLFFQSPFFHPQPIFFSNRTVFGQL